MSGGGRVGANSESCSLSLSLCSCPLSVRELVLVVSEMSVQCHRGSCYGIHRIKAMLMRLTSSNYFNASMTFRPRKSSSFTKLFCN